MCSDSCPIIDTIETDHVNTKGFGFPLHSRSVLHCRSLQIVHGHIESLRAYDNLTGTYSYQYI